LNKTGGRLTSLNDFRDTSARKNEIQAMKILAKVSDRKEAVVLTSSDNEVQVMHPTNYSTIDLRIPQGAEIGEMVQVVQIEEVLYYVP
jgi:nonsense-mediated mRNA decay protein 3